MVFKLKTKGEHLHNNKVFKQGDVIETELPLDKLFENKFERVDKDEDKEYRRPQIPTPGGDEGEKSTPSSPSKKKKRSPFGKLISSQFERTAEAGVKVYIKDHWCTVVSVETGVAISDKKLRKKSVQDFIDGLIVEPESEEEDDEEIEDNTEDEEPDDDDTEDEE